MRSRKRGDDGDELPEFAEGRDEAQKEQQRVDSVQEVSEAPCPERTSCLVPFGIQPDQAWVAALVLENASGTVRRQESQDREDPQAEPIEARVDGKPRLRRLNRVIEIRVERALDGQ